VKLAGHEDYLEPEALRTLLTFDLGSGGVYHPNWEKRDPFREFLHSRNAEGKLPRFHVNLVSGETFVYSQEDLRALKTAEEEQQRLVHKTTLESIPEAERTQEMLTFIPAKFHFVELYEEDYLHELENRLKTYGLILKAIWWQMVSCSISLKMR